MGRLNVKQAAVLGHCVFLSAGCALTDQDPLVNLARPTTSFAFSGGGAVAHSKTFAAKTTPDAGLDSSTLTCAFTTDASSVHSSTTGVQIVTGASPSSSSCTDKNACILCTTATSGANCSIACTGTIPSNTATANDSFNIYVTYTVALSTTLGAETGVVVITGAITNWAEFAFTNQASPPIHSSNFTSCSSPNFLSFNFSDPLGKASTTATAFTQDGDVTSAGSGANLGDCTFTYAFKANMPFTGANTPGTSINLSRGSVALTVKICDTIVTCEL